MSDNEKTMPVIPEGFPQADKTDELTPEQMQELMDEHGFTVREIAEMYDGLSWQKVARTVAKLRDPGGKPKTNAAPEQGLKPEVSGETVKKLRPTAFSGTALGYRVEGDILVLRRTEGNEMQMPLSLLNVMISELQELSEVIGG